jgi:thymidine kinase
MSKSEKVDKLHAICMTCGNEASRTQRLVNGKPAHYDDPVVIVGASELYEARCREHHEVPRDGSGTKLAKNNSVSL